MGFFGEANPIPAPTAGAPIMGATKAVDAPISDDSAEPKQVGPRLIPIVTPHTLMDGVRDMLLNITNGVSRALEVERCPPFAAFGSLPKSGNSVGIEVGTEGIEIEASRVGVLTTEISGGKMAHLGVILGHFWNCDQFGRSQISRTM